MDEIDADDADMPVRRGPGRRERSTLRFDTSECFVGRQFELGDFCVRQTSNTISKTRLRNGPHLKGQRHRRLRRTILACLDDRRPSEVCSIEVRRQRNHEHCLQCSCQGITLPNDDGAPTHLLARPVRPEIGPPDFASFQRRSSRSRAVAQSARPSSASVWSPLLCFDRRSRSQRAGSGRRTTTIPTRSPGRSARRRMGRSTPSSNSASMISMS